jgi:hypothetical protein
MNTIEGNKLIAEFMGGRCFAEGELSDIGYGTIVVEGWKPSGSFYKKFFAHEKEQSLFNDVVVSNSPYHSSWDWQLPVWNKMYELCTANFKLSITKYYEQEKGLHSAIRLNQPEISIPYLIDLIEWYNKEQSVQVSDTTKAT